MLEAAFLISWVLMFSIGFISSLGLISVYSQLISRVVWPLRLLGAATWFITLPVLATYTLWSKRQQIQTMTEQLSAIQQMQQQLAAFNQLSFATEEKEDVDSKNYEQ